MNEPDHAAELDALFAAMREHQPDTSAAEFAFETRLLARLRTARENRSIWASVSWRLLPFFAACVLALTVWHSHLAAETSDAETFATLQNPDATEWWEGN